ncbi:transmembrane transporter Liz1p [Cryptococcus neoformans C23]|uniref:Transmembrane transporter Liz1p n=1 Tax=Cryptococcus neoformans (strain H99 / ATCC 208821 / CBS 10515 / FGSC 9487) TaxID=235443 RepID=J9VXT3_CRYN9|nr:transmembrane transporter Liz1p [Cryptococcus neoformans var. grubii H99]AUB28344.1 transmembrane transporter Liz1p [Cryptococcus neoformans var. grubii]OWZ27366.1 transmembrane transporter Liz1p [Cryptococcus neoformans var. grubii AD2-60a]OWZ39427.1 transmembrane transporter Liz1p [Cryptococcus neoformans var. grubii C23]OXC81626.1 transmembrane transporter Liz1p [Cryptococcus neoformans var. grubii AD1-7a]OXG39298.1 transmembrane transporter Liz1p [Cryptococcus neoformans var. grubii Bt1|eukprot:XP_012052957.1 transmembrane transporter Liz1p [Cryptococcus neoformans var. grubii H99]
MNQYSETPRVESTSFDLDYEDHQPYTRQRERRFLWKLDVCLISWAWLAYLIKQIDSSNYKTAYVSGMKEDMKLNGNELNYLNTYFKVGYAIFLIPSQIVLTRVRPSLWLPPLELSWGVMTGLMAAAHSVKGMYALRFFIGAFEASSYPGIVSVLCNWYTPSELATRIALFGTSYPAASMFVSFMQVSIQSTLNGAHGISGWRWLFIFNAIMTILVAIAGFFLVPDSPGTTKAYWMSDEDNRISASRMARVHKQPPTRLTKAILKKTFTGWPLYIFFGAYAFAAWAADANSWFMLWLKALTHPDGSKRFTIQEINAIPIGGFALMLILMLLFAWLSSRTGWRATWVTVQNILFLIGCIILSVWPGGIPIKMVGFFLTYTANAISPILVAWMADVCPIPEERAMIIGVTVSLVYAMDSWMNLFIYPASQAPKYKVGYKAAAAFTVASIIFTGIFKKFETRDKRLSAAKAAENSISPQHGREMEFEDTEEK